MIRSCLNILHACYNSEHQFALGLKAMLSILSGHAAPVQIPQRPQLDWLYRFG
jgi:hypothetical protein